MVVIDFSICSFGHFLVREAGREWSFDSSFFLEETVSIDTVSFLFLWEMLSDYNGRKIYKMFHRDEVTIRACLSSQTTLFYNIAVRTYHHIR